MGKQAFSQDAHSHTTFLRSCGDGEGRATGTNAAAVGCAGRPCCCCCSSSSASILHPIAIRAASAPCVQLLRLLPVESSILWCRGRYVWAYWRVGERRWLGHVLPVPSVWIQLALLACMSVRGCWIQSDTVKGV